MEKYEEVGLIGKGSQGKVFRVKRKSDNEVSAYEASKQARCLGPNQI
jgi:hypothetical protein